MKNLLLILLATLFVACNERARHDDGSLKYITVDFSKESSKERFAVNKMGRYSFPVNALTAKEEKVPEKHRSSAIK